MRPKFKSEKGFSLTELLVTIAILAVLFAIVSSSFEGWQKNSRDSEARTNLEKAGESVSRFLVSYNAVPAESGLVPDFLIGDLISSANRSDPELNLSEKPSIASIKLDNFRDPKKIYLIVGESNYLNRSYVIANQSGYGDVFSITVSRSGVTDPVVR